jgi:aminoglycoside phosphotransferase (APT) family kinase protein
VLTSQQETLTAVDPAFPRAVKAEIERTLGTELTSIVRQRSGISGRCYLIGGQLGHWIARFEAGSPPALQKALLAQERAGAAGVRVPGIIARRLELRKAGEYSWMVEEYVRGDEFYPERMDPALRKPTSADIGRQLRLLHGVELAGFGDLTRDLHDAPHANWADWMDEQETRVEEAVRIAACRVTDIPFIKDAYHSLRRGYGQSPRLCHGDFSDDNLLVRAGALLAVVDWERALAGDPASDVAYWFMWHGDAHCLDGLLAGYAPADASGFRRRVADHLILCAVKFICSFNERHDADGVEHCRRILTGASAYV